MSNKLFVLASALVLSLGGVTVASERSAVDPTGATAITDDNIVVRVFLGCVNNKEYCALLARNAGLRSPFLAKGDLPCRGNINQPDGCYAFTRQSAQASGLNAPGLIRNEDGVEVTRVTAIQNGQNRGVFFQVRIVTPISVKFVGSPA